MSEKTKAIANLVVDAVLVLNILLQAMGKHPLPVNEEMLYTVVSYTALGIWNIWIWWKNQNVTIEAETAQAYMNLWKAQKDIGGGEGSDYEPIVEDFDDEDSEEEE